MADSFNSKKLIVTADDFGLCPEVNAAVIRAHREGILTDASLMITAQEACEAVRLARQTPTLKVGLHLVLVEGYSVASQKLSNHVVWTGLRYFFSKKMRRWVEAECEAQIQKFLAAGLELNHLDSHNHLHIHPVIADIVVRLAKKYKVGRVRVPWQGWSLQTAAMAPWALRLRRRLTAAGLGFNDWMFGLRETGHLTEGAWLHLIPKMREGLTEIYCHPATASAPALQKTMPRYRHLEELKALLSPKVRAALAEKGVRHLFSGEGQ